MVVPVFSFCFFLCRISYTKRTFNWSRNGESSNTILCTCRERPNTVDSCTRVFRIIGNATRSNTVVFVSTVSSFVGRLGGNGIGLLAVGIACPISTNTIGFCTSTATTTKRVAWVATRAAWAAWAAAWAACAAAWAHQESSSIALLRKYWARQFLYKAGSGADDSFVRVQIFACFLSGTDVGSCRTLCNAVRRESQVVLNLNGVYQLDTLIIAKVVGNFSISNRNGLCSIVDEAAFFRPYFDWHFVIGSCVPECGEFRLMCG